MSDTPAQGLPPALSEERPKLSFAVFDEHGKPADDRVDDYGFDCFKRGVYAGGRAALQASPGVAPAVKWKLCKHCGHDMKEPCSDRNILNEVKNCHWNQEYTRVLGTGLVNNRPDATPGAPDTVAAPAVAAWSISLDEEAAQMLKDTMCGDESSASPITLGVGEVLDDEGAPDYGLFVYLSEYPDEGVMLLKTLPRPATPTADTAAALRAPVAEPASELCQPNGLMFDALGEPRKRYVRVSLDGRHCVMRPSEGDTYISDARADGDESPYVVADVWLSEREFEDLGEFDGF